MSSDTFGEVLRVTTFGESHGAALGAVLDGVPAGIPIDVDFIRSELARRRPGQSNLTTRRNESDEPEVLSGVFEGVSTGTPLAILIRNSDFRSKDYSNIAGIFRPGHADYGYFAKYGIRDYRGGGRSSGRETAARVAAGAVAKLLLKDSGIRITAFTLSVGNVVASEFDEAEIEKNPVRCADARAAELMAEEIKKAMSERDSVGGVVECRIKNVPAGLGEPVFDKLDAVLAHAMMSIGGVKAIEFGDGFRAVLSRGSENNDQSDGCNYLSNHAGGICGGITNGNDIIFRIAVKPTPSIALKQHTFDVSGNAVECEIKGRHDPCLCPRIVPVVEAMTALVMADMVLRSGLSRLQCGE